MKKPTTIKREKLSTYSFTAGVKTFLQLSVYANLYRTCNEIKFFAIKSFWKDNVLSVCKRKDLNMNLFLERTKLETSSKIEIISSKFTPLISKNIRKYLVFRCFQGKGVERNIREAWVKNILWTICGSRYSRMDKAKFVEGSLKKSLLSPFLNTLTQIIHIPKTPNNVKIESKRTPVSELSCWKVWTDPKKKELR